MTKTPNFSRGAIALAASVVLLSSEAEAGANRVRLADVSTLTLHSNKLTANDMPQLQCTHGCASTPPLHLHVTALRRLPFRALADLVPLDDAECFHWSSHD
jgi:hypothetical protein